MSKPLLMASMWVMILVPLSASLAPNALEGFKRMVLTSFALTFLWALVVLAVFSARLNRDPAALLPEPVEATR